MSEKAFISIIVICYNEEKYLELCLKSLSEQKYPRELYEIIVVDNGSTDNSQEIAKKYADHLLIHPKIKVGALRNVGARVAKGSILAFLDGDCETKENWLSIINELNNKFPNTLNGAGCLLPENCYWMSKAFLTPNLLGRQQTTSLTSQNFALPTSIFQEVGGFDESLTAGEDVELFMRVAIKYQTFSDDSLEVLHYGVPQSFRMFFGREMWHGLGAFGSFKINYFDKPLLATFVFIFGYLLIFFGLVQSLLWDSSQISQMGLVIVFLIPLLSTIYRRDCIHSFMHGVQVCIVYFFYFFARSLSLFILLLGLKHRYYKSKKND